VVYTIIKDEKNNKL